ncbi:MAG: branched-chain amino acid ABC transporter permease [Candidatus Bipolaricaulia bacterium]
MLELQVGLNGLLLGGIYALMALGMALVWGVMNIVNIAHGAYIVLGGYTAFWLFELYGIDPFLSLPLAMVGLFILGYLIQRYIINYIVRAEIFFTLLVTFGIDILIVNLAQLAWKTDYRTVTPSYLTASLQLGSVALPWARLGAFVVALGITALLFWLLRSTKLGRAIRAVSQDLDAARLSGVNLGRTYAVTYGLGAALAGGAGALLILIMAINPQIGGPLTLKSFVITVLGGLNTAWGPVVGGLTLGIVEEFSSLYIGDTLRNAISFGLLVLMLLLRPQGLLGRREV